MSNWQYHETTGTYSTEATNALGTWIKQNQISLGGCYKFAASDQKGDVARAVVFWTTQEISIPDTQPWHSLWQPTTWSRDGDYSTLYQEIVTQLENLSPYNQFYAQVTYTNAEDNDECMTIWLPA